jgi:hypothetical protein
MALRALVGSFCISGLLCGTSVSAAQDPPKPPANEDCLACHDDKELKRGDGTSVATEPRTFEGTVHRPLACVQCHADLATLTEFPHPDKLAKATCVTCHGDIAAKYHDSIHARARAKGLNVAPACSDCHGKHDTLAKTAALSRIAPGRISTTCGACHAGTRERYDVGAHAAALAKGDARAPTCNTCHTAHSIQRADTEVWKLGVAHECGTCHAAVAESFLRTFHGKVTQLGFTRVATCADCHGAHEILPGSNPLSTVSRAKVVETCQRCHQGANSSFVKYDPHPDPRSYARSPVLWWLNRFYTVLIAGCFGLFGLHSLLWFNRSRRSHPANRAGSEKPEQAS